jgi:diguanylate cyclase (GGDEF)-like protein
MEKKMKLIIQIPCYNEEKILPITLQELPRQVEGFDKVEWLLIDDGSTDDSVKIAKQYNVDHIVKLNQHKGLAEVFLRGLDACVKLGADVIVNTDADNQYNAKDIPKLVKPILEGNADIVIGARPIIEIPHFSSVKKILQKLGSWVVRRLSYTDIPDAPSGFRAISREAAMKLNVFNTYTYTLETIIQAGNKNIAIMSVPIQVNKELRPSRLVKSIYAYITDSIITIVRIFIVYRPFKTFMSIGIVLFFMGFLIGVRFLYFYFTAGGVGHFQSLILAGTLLGFGFQTMITAFLADLLAVNRRLLEDVQHRLKQLETNERFTRHIAFITQKLSKTLEMGSIRDPLTGLYTRRYLEAFLEQEAHRTEYRNAPIGFILFDIDHFSEIHRIHGKEAGDKVLCALGGLLRSSMRGNDIACRYDGEKFLLILPNAPFHVTKQRAEEFKEKIRALRITYQDEILSITASWGVATLPNHGPDAWDAVKTAEIALNQAKTSGYDQMMIASP